MSRWQGAVQIRFVDRELDTLIQIDTINRPVTPYEEAAIEVPNHQELHDVPVTRLAQLVHQIINVEGPIHFDEVVTRIRTLWGLQRAGTRIRDALERTRQMLVTDRTAIAEQHFLDIPGRPVRVRDRTSVRSTTLRKPEYLPPSEIQQAICSVLRENLRGQREEIPSAVGQVLGFSVVSAQLRETVWAQLDALHHQRAVQMQGSVYRVS